MKNSVQKMVPVSVSAVENNNVVLNSSSNIFLKPSAEGAGFRGLHGNNSWYDKAARLFDSGELSIEFPESFKDSTVTYTFGGKDYSFSIETTLQAALYEGITNNRLPECLEIWAKGFVGAGQVRESEKGRETSLMEKYPIFAELEFSSVSRQKGSKLLAAMKEGITKEDLSAIEAAGYKVSGRILSDDLLAPAVIGLKIEVPAEE